jgi:hypothetical protein
MALQTFLALSAAAVSLLYLFRDLGAASLWNADAPGCHGCATGTCPVSSPQA